MNHWNNLASILRLREHDFLAAFRNPRKAQLQLLRDIAVTNAASEVGRRCCFERLDSYRAFAEILPCVHYDDIEADLMRYARGEPTLSAEPIRFIETSSGSTTAAKVIPFSPNKLVSFRNSVRAWFLDLCQSYPGICAGRMYWSISPAVRRPIAQRFSAPIGAPSDLVYFGEDIAQDLQSLLIGLSLSGRDFDIEEWRHATALELVAADDLTMISVWSPTFLIELINFIQANLTSLASDLTKRSKRRSEILQAVAGGSLPWTEELWPKLSLISCWADAGARRYLPVLRKMFPNVIIQGKGLLATEAVVSIPWTAVTGCLPAITSSFLEFKSSGGKLLLVDELTVGETYEVVVTTYAGLYRYIVGDSVRVTGTYLELPILEFVGRSEVVCDLCGEKLADPFVAEVLRDIDGFAMLAPRAGDRLGYTLVLGVNHSPEEGERLLRLVEARLMENPQYHYARRLGQLSPLQLRQVTNVVERYERIARRRGTTAAVVKHPALSTQTSILEELTS